MAQVSQLAIDDVISFEVSSKVYYIKHYAHPEWPGGFSGITIGVGYDLGYASPEKIRADWGALVSPAELTVMLQCSGVHGTAARDLLPHVRPLIDIPWDAACSVFLERDVPQWTDRVCHDIPGADKLPPDSLGAIFSCAYNRGDSFSAPGDRFVEMRNIRAHIVAGHPELVPGELRAMKRLWPDVKGLRDRREVEAKLFEAGLAAARLGPVLTPVAPVPHTATPAPKQALPPPKPGTAEHGLAGAVILAIGKAAHDAAANGHGYFVILGIIIAAVAAAAVVWKGVSYARSLQPQTARQKG